MSFALQNLNKYKALHQLKRVKSSIVIEEISMIIIKNNILISLQIVKILRYIARMLKHMLSTYK